MVHEKFFVQFSSKNSNVAPSFVRCSANTFKNSIESVTAIHCREHSATFLFERKRYPHCGVPCAFNFSGFGFTALFMRFAKNCLTQGRSLNSLTEFTEH